MNFYLFVVYLTTRVQWLRVYTIEWKGDKWMINRKGFGRKQSRPNFKVLSRLEGLSKTMRTSVRIFGLWVVIWSRLVPNTKQECQTRHLVLSCLNTNRNSTRRIRFHRRDSGDRIVDVLVLRKCKNHCSGSPNLKLWFVQSTLNKSISAGQSSCQSNESAELVFLELFPLEVQRTDPREAFVVQSESHETWIPQHEECKWLQLVAVVSKECVTLALSVCDSCCLPVVLEPLTIVSYIILQRCFNWMDYTWESSKII
jgi:hypothetical protein